MASHPQQSSPSREGQQRPDWLNWDSYPFELRTLSSPEGDTAFIDEGDGPPLLFVHVGMWSFVWRDVIVRLRQNYRCIAIDPPGSGLSSHPTTGPPSISDAAHAVDQVVRHLNLNDMALVFHDLGGPASLLAVGNWPSRVRLLVAVNTFGWRPSGLLLPLMLGLMGSAPMSHLNRVTGWLPRISATHYGVGRHLDKPDRRVFRAGMQGRQRRTFHSYVDSARPGHTDYPAIETNVQALADRPLTTVFGERNDPGHFQERWLERFPNTTQVVVPGGYHFPMCDDPDLVAAAIDDAYARSTVPPEPLQAKDGR
ncbi:MAG TPA: alpha/beta fold hydrolase [Acidimicrobiia bacterium]|nr:alpha/beta fold hydrolase [Acidimicrobiia bacterium]